jgi:hypothetical protein
MLLNNGLVNRGKEIGNAIIRTDIGAERNDGLLSYKA